MQSEDVNFIDVNGERWHLVPKEQIAASSGCHLVRRGAYSWTEERVCHDHDRCTECQFAIEEGTPLTEYELNFTERLLKNQHLGICSPNDDP